jgi:type IV pilus assembly protein PilN
MVRINLLPVRVSKKKEAGQQQLVLFAVVLVGGIVFNVLFNQSREQELSKKDKDLAYVRAQIAELNKVIQDVDKIKAEKATLNRKLETLEALRKGRTGPVRMLSELAENTPRRLWLKKMEEKAGKVVFLGNAASLDDISEFLRKLKESKYFDSVELKRTEGKDAAGLRSFEFEIRAVGTYTPALTPDGAASKGKG